MLKYDSVLGNLHAKVEVSGDGISVEGDLFKVLSLRDPAQLPWKDLGVDVVAVHRGAVVIPVDDILTTGGTLAALAGRLRAGGLPVPVAAVLAATRRRTDPRTATE